MKIAVIGSGYVGLVTGAGFSNFGNHVTCVDIDAARVERLRQGEIPFHEPGLAELVQRNARQGRLVFTTDTAEAVREVDVVFLAVGTPSRPDGAADLRYLVEAARQVGKGLTASYTAAGKSREGFIQLAVQMGYNKTEAIRLADQLIAIPNVSRTARLTAQKKDLDTKLAAAQKQLASPNLTKERRAQPVPQATPRVVEQPVAEQEPAAQTS